MNPTAPVAPTAPAPGAVTPSSPQTPTPVSLPATPTYDPSAAIGAIRQLYQIPIAHQASSMATQGSEFNAAQTITNQENQLKLQQQQAASRSDPSKYKVINDPTGKSPTVVIDPDGKQISVADMVKATGTAPVDVLKNSENADEKKFVEAYQNYEGFMKALLNKDTKTLKQYYQNNQGLDGMTPENVRQLFMGQYGNYFGIQQQNVPYGVNRGFIPGQASTSSTALQQALAALGG